MNLNNESKVSERLKQSDRLPESLRLMVGQGIIAYSMVDLSSRFNLVESWVVLTKNTIEYFLQFESTWERKTINISHVCSAKEIENLSNKRLEISDKSGELLLTLRYSLRQQRPMSLVVFLINEGIKLGFIGQVNKSPDCIYQEELLKPLAESAASENKSSKDVIWRLLTYLKPYRGQVALGGLGAACMTVLSLVPGLLTGYLIDDVIKPFQSGVITHKEGLYIFTLCIAALFGTHILREFFAWVRLKTMSIMGEFVARDLRDEVYEHMHGLSLSFFDKRQTGSLISRVSSDTDRIWDFVAFGIVEVSTSILLLFTLSGVLIYLDAPLGLMVSAPVPVLLWLIYRHGQKMQLLFLRAWRKWSDLTDCLSDTIPGIKVVKAFNKGQEEVSKFNQRNAVLLDEFNSIHKAWTSFWPVLMLLIRGLVVAVWFFGVPRVLEHVAAFNEGAQNAASIGLTPGVFISFVVFMTMFVQPIEVIGQMARMINRATSSAHRVFEVLDRSAEVVDTKKAIELKTLKGEIEFKNVTFTYDGVRPVLKNLSFKINPGEVIGLVGPSGSGKTTITNLISRFYDVTSGEITVDGYNLKELDTASFKSHLGVVLQDPFLFHGNILENIRYAKPDADLLDVIAAAKVANAHEFIMKLTNGYETIVGERGQSLSGGERQRVSIARAVLRNPKILILDEATSSVDTETEKKIQEALDRLVKGRTVFAIAHRLSTIASADRILVIKDGELVESGTHQELIDNPKGTYTKFVTLQTNLNKIGG